MSFQRLGRAPVAASALDSFPNLVNEEGHAVVEPLRQVKSISPLENVSSELVVLGDARENILNEVDGNLVIYKLPKPTSRHSFWKNVAWTASDALKRFLHRPKQQDFFLAIPLLRSRDELPYLRDRCRVVRLFLLLFHFSIGPAGLAAIESYQ